VRRLLRSLRKLASSRTSRSFGSINFYRTSYFDARNRRLVELCRAGNRQAILDHLAAQDTGHPELFDDERFENRFGMQEIRDRIRARGAKARILDVACGNADLLVRLHQDGHDVTGVDASPVRADANRSRIPRSIHAFAEEIPLPSDGFDCAIAQECLEHVMDLDKTLAEIRRLLRPGGTLFAQVPDGTFADGVNHVRLFDGPTLWAVVDAAGLVVDSVERVPYLIGEEPHNLFVTAHEPPSS